MLPAYLLNSTALFYAESYTQGPFGEQIQSFAQVGEARVRLDQLSSNRSIHTDKQELTNKEFKMFSNSLPPGVNEKTWAKIVSDDGYEVTGQVSSINYPGLMAHHVEAILTQRSGVTI